MMSPRDSRMGGAPPPDTRLERWIKEQQARFEAIGCGETASALAQASQRVRQDFQERLAASSRQQQRQAFGLRQLRLEGRIIDHG